MKLFLERMIIERNELRDRLDVLENFMESKEYEDLSRYEIEALHEQFDHMTNYYLVLCKRIGFYVEKEAK